MYFFIVNDPLYNLPINEIIWAQLTQNLRYQNLFIFLLILLLDTLGKVRTSKMFLKTFDEKSFSSRDTLDCQLDELNASRIHASYMLSGYVVMVGFHDLTLPWFPLRLGGV